MKRTLPFFLASDKLVEMLPLLYIHQVSGSNIMCGKLDGHTGKWFRFRNQKKRHPHHELSLFLFHIHVCQAHRPYDILQFRL